jgi:hypothetical protein
MEKKTSIFDDFTKVFVQLTEDGRNRLIETAYRLLEAQNAVKADPPCPNLQKKKTKSSL